MEPDEASGRGGRPAAAGGAGCRKKRVRPCGHKVGLSFSCPPPCGARVDGWRTWPEYCRLGGGGSCRPVGAGAYDTGRTRCAEAGMRPVSYAVRARGAASPLVLSDQLVELRHEVGKLRALSAPAYGRQGALVDDVLGQLLQAGGLRHFAVFVVRVREEGHVGIDAASQYPLSSAVGRVSLPPTSRSDGAGYDTMRVWVSSISTGTLRE